MKLYKQIDSTIHFWETWDIDDKTGAINKGIVGKRGEYREVSSKLFTSFRKEIQKEIDNYCKDGYQEVDIEEHSILLIEFLVDGMGTKEDVEKRTRLQDEMDDVLGWTGLGHCDGGSIGSGTMEVCCFVIDFEIAKLVIEQNLKNTEFSNYTRIFEEIEEYDEE
jgi:hypothetical protein